MKHQLTAVWRFFYVQIWRRLKLLWLIFRAWAFNNVYVLDLQLNTLFGGSRGETVSSRLGKGALKGKPVHSVLARLVDVVFKVAFNDRNHCFESIQRNIGENAISDVIERYREGKKQIWSL